MIAVDSRPAAISLGLAVAIVPIVYVPGLFEFTLLPRLLALQAILTVGVSAWLLALRRPLRLRLISVTLPLSVGVSWTLLTVFWCINSVEGVIQAGRTCTYLLLALLTACALSGERMPRVYAAACAAGTANALIGIGQYFGWAGLEAIPTAANPSATFGYRNFAASYLVVTIPTALAFGWSASSKARQAGWFLSALTMALFLVYTRTRGAWLGLGFSLLIGACVVLYCRRVHRASFPIQ